MTNASFSARLRMLAARLDGESLSASQRSALGDTLATLEAQVAALGASSAAASAAVSEAASAGPKADPAAGSSAVPQPVPRSVPSPELTVGNRQAGLGAGGQQRAEEACKRGKVRIWSDGSCSPNPGAGGWGAIVEMDGQLREFSGATRYSTNNIMEMTAAIEALRVVPPGTIVQVTSDSEYLINGATKWLRGWKRKKWRKSNGEAVRNQDLWQALDELLSTRKVTWQWVRGHTGHPENERCDELANAARAGLTSSGTSSG